MPRNLAVLAAVVLSCGCEDPPTQVVVRLATNLSFGSDPGDDFDSIHLIIRDQDGEPVRDQVLADLEDVPSDGRYHEIGSFGILPRGGDATRRFEVSATAMKGGVQLFETYVRSSFVRKHTIRLDLYLPRLCIDLARTCMPDETCGIAGCVSPDVDPARLPLYSPDDDPMPRDPRSAAMSYISPGPERGELIVPRETLYVIGADHPATILYTLDGSEPRRGSGTTMSAPAPVQLPPLGTATIRWRAVDEDGDEEAVHMLQSILDPAVAREWGHLTEKVDMNGRGPFVEVSPDAPIELTFDRTIWTAVEDPCVDFCVTQYLVSVDGVGTVHCDEYAGWPEFPPGRTDRPVAMFRAPLEQGQYAVRARYRWDFMCVELGPRPEPGQGGVILGYVFVR